MEHKLFSKVQQEKDKIRQYQQGYKSENVSLQYQCSLTNEEAEKLIGKTINKVQGAKFGITLIFSDGTSLCVEGVGMKTGSPSALDTTFDANHEKI